MVNSFWKDGENPVEFQGALIRKTDKAILLHIDGAPEEKMWLPLSQIYISSDAEEEGKEVTVEMPQWLAKKKELI